MAAGDNRFGNSLRVWPTGEIKGVTEIALMPCLTRWGEFYQRRRAVVKNAAGRLADPDGFCCRRHDVQRRGATKRRLSGGGDCRLNASLLWSALDRRTHG